MLIAQYSNEDPGLVLQVAGQCIWKNYLQSAVLEPEKHGVVDHSLDPKHKKDLSEIAKVLSQVALGRLFGEEGVLPPTVESSYR